MANNGEPSNTPKAIASLAKKSSDVTRQGTQKLKFVPTLPARRKKEQVKQEAPQTSAQPSDKGDGRGRGRGRGRGETRNAAPRPPAVEMTASGPFSMGPALAGTSTRRSTPRSNVAPIAPHGAKGSALSVNLSNSAAPTLNKEKQREIPVVDPAQPAKDESDDEVYSEPDEGVEIIDMENVRQLDWMAPETLLKDRRDQRKRRQMKTEVEESASQGPSVENAYTLDLSESEEELENLMEDFAVSAGERLYFFQFPDPFPTFASTSEFSRGMHMDVDTPDPGPSTLKRKVSFAADVGPPSSGSATPATKEAPKEAPKVDGMIGHIEVYRSGAVKMRLGNGIILNVSEATQPSFLQQAVHLDMENKTLHVLGEINKRFVVSPDIDALLTSMELAESTAVFDDTNLIKMDPI